MKKLIGIAIFSLLLTASMAVGASDWEDNWGPEVGSELPEVSVDDTDGNEKSLKDLTGDSKGLLLFFVRTSNW